MRVVVDSMVRVHVADLRALGVRPRDLVALCEYDNPDFWKKQRMGMWTGTTPRKLSLAVVGADEVALPRGAFDRVRERLEAAGAEVEVVDRTVSGTGPLGLTYREPAEWRLGQDQLAAARACVRYRRGLVLGPCASGKTQIALKAVADVGERTLVVVHTERILDVWRRAAVARLGLREDDVGLLYGRVKRERPLTIGLVQTLRNVLRKDPGFAKRWGCVVLDEAHHAAASSFSEVISSMPAKWRLAFTATPKRKDGKEPLMHDVFGGEWVEKARGEGRTVGPRILFRITDEDLDREGRIVPVDVVVVPTEFEFDLHREAELDGLEFERRARESALARAKRWAFKTGFAGSLREYTDLLDAAVRDDRRRDRILAFLLPEVAEGHTCLMLADRRELGLEMQAWLERKGVRADRLMGGARDAKRQDEVADALAEGRLQVAVGTTVADEGMDVPRLDRGFGCTPAASNPGRLTQQFGRLKRLHPGKVDAVYFYFWDRRVRSFREHAREVARIVRPPHRVWFQDDPAGPRVALGPNLLRRLETEVSE